MPTELTRCARKVDGKPCGRVAFLYPVLELRIRAERGHIDAHMPLPHCRACAKTTKVKDLMGNDGYLQILKGCEEAGLEPPARDLTTFRFEPLSHLPKPLGGPREIPHEVKVVGEKQ